MVHNGKQRLYLYGLENPFGEEIDCGYREGKAESSCFGQEGEKRGG